MTPLESLQHWERMGGEWRVVGRLGAEVQVALITCTGGEEVDRIITSDPELIAYVSGSADTESPTR